MLHFLCRVERALETAGVPVAADDDQQQQRKQQQQQKQQQHVIVAHTYIRGKGHQAEKLLLSQGRSPQSPPKEREETP